MPGETKIPFVPPTFSWDSPNLYSNYKLFKQKVEMAFKGQFKDCDNGSKVGAILNWLGDNAYEIYEKMLLTRTTLIMYLKLLRSTSSQSRTSFTPGIH